MEEIPKPELSHRFDVDDIRKLREYYSLRHCQMTREEVVADIRNGAEKILREYGLNPPIAQNLRQSLFYGAQTRRVVKISRGDSVLTPNPLLGLRAKRDALFQLRN